MHSGFLIGSFFHVKVLTKNKNGFIIQICLYNAIYIKVKGENEMARKTQITREVILEAAFRKLVRDGYSSINITSLAREIGCSTQPIAWHFGNMEGLRTELLDHCLAALRDQFSIEGESASTIIDNIAAGYIELALDRPNLYKYLYMSEQDGEKMSQLSASLRKEHYEKVVHMLAEEQGISKEAAERCMIDIQIYVHGIAANAVSHATLTSKEIILRMAHEAKEAFLMRARKRQ